MSAISYGHSYDLALNGVYKVKRPSIRPLEIGECYVYIRRWDGKHLQTKIGRHRGVGWVEVLWCGEKVRAKKRGSKWTYTPSREGTNVED